MPDNDIQQIVLENGSPAHEILMRRLQNMYDDAIAYHSTQWDDKHDLYQRLYLAMPRNAIKTKPFMGASNLFMPMTRVVTHSILYREDDAFFNQEPFISVRAIGKPDAQTSVSQQRLMSSEKLDLYYQSFYRYVCNLRGVTKIALKENAIDGTAVLHPRWSRDYVMQRIRDVEWKVKYSSDLIDVLGHQDSGTAVKSIDPFWKERLYRRNIEQAVIENGNLSNVYVAPGSGPSLQWPECQWYFILRDLDWQQCQYRRKNGYNGVDDELKATLGMAETEKRQRTVEQDAGITPDGFGKTTPLVEFYMRLPLPGDFEDIDKSTISQSWSDIDDGWEEEVIVSVWWATKTIARIRPLARVLPPNAAGIYLRPHVDLRYQTLPRFFYGMGIPQMMFHLNKALNQYMNQAVDSGTLRNVPFFFYEPSLGLMPDIIGVKPGQGIAVSNASGVKVPQFNGDNRFFMEMMQVVQSWADRDSNVNSFNQGLSDSKTNPETARMGLALLNESNLAFTGLASEHASQIERLFEITHLLHQRNAPEYLNYREPSADATSPVVEGKIHGAAFAQNIEVRFNLNPNRSAEQQNAQALFQFMMAIPFVNSQPRAVRALARNAWDKAGTPGTKPDFDTEIWPEEVYQIQQDMADTQLQMQKAQADSQKAQMQQQVQQPPGLAPGGPPSPASPFPGVTGMNLPRPEQPDHSEEDVMVA